MLVGFGILVRPLLLLSVDIQVLRTANPANWNVLTNPGSSGYHPLVAPTFIFEIIANSALLVFAILLAVLYFQRRFSFPRVFSIFLAATIAVVLLDTVMTASIPAVGVSPAEYGRTTRDVILSLIWIAYFHTSKRVASTFVQRRKGEADLQAAAVLAAS